ncbi:MAG: energy-coupling factor transporter transmembrane protein EcfT [Leucobacter sp.]|nr:energy-coupling factor transporter transmembrane protein EcfT [Leucobacter sp.]
MLVVLASTVILMPGGEKFVPAALVLGLLLAATERAWKRIFALAAVAFALAVMTAALPMRWSNPAVVVLASLSSYTVRFVAIGSIATHLAATTSPGEFASALRAARLPRAFVVPATVMLRFSPVVMAEARAVIDAMKLRGLANGRSVLRHPVRALEQLMIPLMASSLRAADDLSASALLRGLGASGVHPTTMRPLRFGRADAVCLALVIVLTGATVAGTHPC